MLSLSTRLKPMEDEDSFKGQLEEAEVTKQHLEKQIPTPQAQVRCQPPGNTNSWVAYLDAGGTFCLAPSPRSLSPLLALSWESLGRVQRSRTGEE